MKESVRLHHMFWPAAIFATLDAWFTYLYVGNGLAVEINPIMSWLMDHLGYGWGMFVRAWAGIMFVAFLAFKADAAERPSSKFGIYLSAWAFCLITVWWYVNMAFVVYF